MTVNLYPRSGVSVLAENGSSVPADGIAVAITNYYRTLIVRGDLLTYDPRQTLSGTPTPLPPYTTGAIPTYTTAEALRGVVGAAPGQIAATTGVLAAGDGGGGTWYWDASDNTSTDNTGTVLGTGSGRWKRVISSTNVEVDPKFFGATGDGITDDSAKAQQALNWLRDLGGGRLLIRAVYAIKNIDCFGGIEIAGSGPQTGFILVSGAQYGLGVNRADGGTADPANNAKHIRFRDFQITGRCVSDGFSEFVPNFFLSAVSDVLLEGVWCTAFQGDGVILASGVSGTAERHNESIVIRGCRFDGVNNQNRNAVSIIDGTNVTVADCTFVNCTKATMPGAVDMEPDQPYERIDGVKVTGNRFSGVGGNVGVVSLVLWQTQADRVRPARSVFIDGNVFDNTCTNTSLVTALQVGSASASTEPVALTITNNLADGFAGNYQYLLAGIRGVIVDNNSWKNCGAMPLVGFGGSRNCHDVYLGPGERFYKCGSVSTSGLSIFDCSKLKISATFDSCGATNGSFGYAIDFGAGTSSDVDVSGVRIIPGGRTTYAIQKEAGHTFAADTNRLRGLDTGGLAHSFQAYATGEVLTGAVTVDVPSIANGGSYSSADIAVPGASLGDPVTVAATVAMQGLVISGYVRAAEQVRFILYNNTGGAVDLASGTYYVFVTKR